MTARIHPGSIEHLLQSSLALSDRGSHDIRLWKADFSSAYRCCPILEEHLPFSTVIVRDAHANVHAFEQLAMPFGAVAAVYAWDRIGEALVHIFWFLKLV